MLVQRSGAVVALGLLVSACASTPDVTIAYYPAKSLTTFQVTENVACTQDEMKLIATNAVTAATEYSADTSAPARHLRLKALDNDFADAALSVELFGDGRLKAINASSTGEGQAVITAAAGLAGTMGPMLGMGPQRPRKLPICAVLKNWAGGKATLTFVKSFDLAQVPSASSHVLNDEEAAVSDPGLYEQIADVLPRVTFSIGDKTPVPRPAAYVSDNADSALALALRDTSTVRLDFDSDGHWLGAKTLTIPGPGDYVLPIPKAALFGGQTFSIALSESGAVTSLSYGKTSGAAAAIGSATAVATTVTPSP
jgi:hypothetical protein